MSSTTVRIKIEKCREWAVNPTVNPLTGKTIKVNGPKYNELKEVCLRKYNITPQQVAEEGEPVAEAPAPEGEPAVEPPAPVQSRSNSSSRSPSYQQAVLRRRTAKNASLTANEKWIAKRCTNEEQDMITLEELSETDISNIFVIYMKNRDGSKWIKKGICNKRDDFYEFLTKDQHCSNIIKEEAIVNAEGIPRILHHQPKLAMSILANWIQTDPDRPINPDGTGGRAGHKLFIKVPGNNILITLKSYIKIQENTDIKEWYALPLFNKEKILVGNLHSVTTVVGVSHGQGDGSIIYKLYTKEEIDSLRDGTVLEDDDEYNSLLVKRPRDIWNTPLINNTNVNIYIRKSIKSILLHKQLNLQKCKYLVQCAWIYNNDPIPGYDCWINPFDNKGHQYNENADPNLYTYRGRYNYNHTNYDINRTIYIELYSIVYCYVKPILLIEFTFDIFSKIIEFLIYYLTRNSLFGTFRTFTVVNKAIFVISATHALINNNEYTTRSFCIDKIKNILQFNNRTITYTNINNPAFMAPYINTFDTNYTSFKTFIDESKFNEYSTIYDLIMNCNYLTNSNLININKDDKLEKVLRYMYTWHNNFRFAPIYTSRLVIKSILLGKSNQIFKVKLPKIEEYNGLLSTNTTVSPPTTPLDPQGDPNNRLQCTEIPFW